MNKPKCKHSKVVRYEPAGEGYVTKVVFCDICGERSDGKVEDPITKKIVEIKV